MINFANKQEKMMIIIRIRIIEKKKNTDREKFRQGKIQSLANNLVTFP